MVADAPTIDHIRRALQCQHPSCDCHKERGNVHCPAHVDDSPSLSLKLGDDGKVLVHCFSGCSQDAVIAALQERDLWPESERTKVTIGTNGHVLTVAELAEAKHLEPALLASYGVKDSPNGVRIPYRDERGTTVAARFRRSLTGSRFKWRTTDHPILYGLDRLTAIREAGWCLMVEGESDSWTCWQHGIPALGIPGKDTWQPAWKKHLTGLSLYLWVEPDAADTLPQRVGNDLPDIRLLYATETPHKDLSAAHIAGEDIPALVERLKASARSWRELSAERQAAARAEAETAAKAVLDHNDPLALVKTALIGLRYGGDVRTPLLIYLAFTSRLLNLRPGQMPCHILLIGPASIGKSYAWQIAARLLPESAYIVTDASSPRAIIYETADVKHRVLVIGEADSLPAGEDNPAASAVRTLLQDGELTYKLVVRDEAGHFTVESITREGPTVLVTSAVQSLGSQLMTRLMPLEIPTSHQQIAGALSAQADVELFGVAEPAPELVAYQEYLQQLAPINVIVPYADHLARYLAAQPAVPPRVTRDFAKLLSLVKAAAIIRHAQRETDAHGRLLATVEDYAAIYELVGEAYRAQLSAGEKLRAAVEAVVALVMQGKDPIRVSDVARRLNIPPWDASRRVSSAVEAGYLVNREERKRHPAKLGTGDPLPDDAGLPTPERLAELVEGAAAWSRTF